MRMVLNPREGDLPHRAVANDKIPSSRRRKLGHLTPKPDDLPTLYGSQIGSVTRRKKNLNAIIQSSMVPWASRPSFMP